MKNLRVIYTLILLQLLVKASFGQIQRAPSYPLITHNTFFSIWANTDTLNDITTTHWDGTSQALTGLIKVDSTTYSFMGQFAINPYKTILLATDQASYTVDYTFNTPTAGWQNLSYNDSGWTTTSDVPFTNNTSQSGTQWQTSDLWVRRTFTIDSLNINNLILKLSHDDNIEVYLNGVEVYSEVGYNASFQYFPIQNNLVLGENIIAIHIHNTYGGAYLDFGLVAPLPLNQANTITQAKQQSVVVTPTQTIYNFTCGSVNLQVNFMSPLLLDDLNVLARPVSYINYTVNATDGNQHNVSVFLGASSNIARNNTTQLMQANKYTSNELSILKAGTAVQNILVTNNNLINWGFMYVAAPQSSNPVQFFSQEIPPDVPFIASADTTTTTQSTDLLLNTILPFGAVGASPVHKYIEIGYDDLYPIQYFGTNLLPYWKTTGNTIEDELTRADTASASIFKRCNTFDADLYNDAQKAGGTNYAKLCALAYRQSISAHVMTKDPQGNLLFLSKENSSGGFVTTVDVAYPSSPLFLFYNPVLIEGLLNGVFYYCESGKWTAPFAPHDIGHYPLVTGQGYFGNMPVEESGNMILMVAAMERAEGNSDYAKLHWPTITKWANYLNGVGYNPPNQLTSDDFAGVIASSVNLSAKLINGVAAYAGLAKAMGDTSTFNTYYSSAQQMAASWVANGDAGTNSLLAFNQPGTWSQTYNIIWDKMLGLKLFPQSVYDKNVKFYKSQLNAYGLPLDDRQTYTKGDWSMFTAIMASADSDFKALTDPIYAFATQTPNRYPLTDFYYTLTPTRDEFDARSVVGAFFIKMLERKWSLNTICTTPANLATNNITTSSAILNWAQSASAENYIFQGKAADSTNWRNFTLYALDSTYAFTGLRPKTTYQWRIASVCQSYPPVASEYSATQTFTTLSIPDSVKTGGALTITLSPNPAMDIATLHIANASGTVAVQLTNMVGIVMWKSGNSSYSNINIPINNIGSGVYIVTVKNNGQVRSLRLIKN